MEKYHFSVSVSQTVRTFFSSNNRKACCCVISLLLLFDAVKIGNYLICGTTFARKKFRENQKKYQSTDHNKKIISIFAGSNNKSNS
jgi:hypothetical protein